MIRNGHPKHKPATGITNAVIFGFYLFIALLFGVFVASLHKDKPAPTGECVSKITLPQIMLDSGWKIEGHEDLGWLNSLARAGKVEKQALPGLVTQTCYPPNETPVTTIESLAMYKVLP